MLSFVIKNFSILKKVAKQALKSYFNWFYKKKFYKNNNNKLMNFFLKKFLFFKAKLIL